MNPKEKIIIYQVLTRLFGNQSLTRKTDGSINENGCGKMDYFTEQILSEIKELGVTHIWYTGVIAHATQTDYSGYGINKDHPAIVKGKAGSPYAIKDYYDIDPDLAMKVDERMKEFDALVTRTHNADMKIIIDFVPNHVARQYKSLAKPEGTKDLGEDDNTGISFSPQNNFYYIPGEELKGDIDFHVPGEDRYTETPAKATGNNRFDTRPDRNDWYDTVKLNYGVDYINNTGCHFSPVPDTWMKMKDILLFWAGKNIDGFRCDMAEMVPCEFWGWVIPQVKEKYPDIIFIAEVYNPQEYRNYIHNGHFDYLYDKVGLYDTLRAVVCNRASATDITGCWQSVDDIKGHMLNFMENHDEQRIASDFFAGDPHKAFAAMIVSACMNTNPVMIYFGQELGESGMDAEGFSGRDGRTTIFDYWTVDSIRRWTKFRRFRLLNAKEKGIRNFYKTLLNICNEEKCIARGKFFDLMYANTNGWQMDWHKQYAFLRQCEDEALLVAVNFRDMNMRVAINIPQYAFECLGMPEMGEIKAKDLISGKEEKINFTSTRPVGTDLPANSGKILKIKLK